MLFFIRPFKIAAGSRIDSLETLSKSANTQQKTDALLALAHYYSAFNTEKSFTYASEALLVSKQNGLIIQGIKAHNLLADAFAIAFKLDSAKAHYVYAMQNSKDINSSLGLVWSYIHMGAFYSEIGVSDSTIFFLNEASKIINVKAGPEEIAMLNEAYGNYYKSLKDYSKAIDYYNKSLKYYRQLNDARIIDVLYQEGNTCFDNNNQERALECYAEIYKSSLSNNDHQGIGMSLYGQARVNSAQKHYIVAEKLFNTALENFTRANNDIGIANTFLKLAIIANEGNNSKQAVKYGLLAVGKARGVKNKNIICEAYGELTKAYMANNNYKEAYQAEKIKSRYADSIHNTELMQKMAGIRIRYESPQKEAENSGLKATNASRILLLEKQTNMKWYILIILIFTLAISLMVYIGNNNKKKNLNRLQLQNLVIEDKHNALAALNAEILDQKKQLEVTNNFKNRLFSIVSHDFRSPLLSLKSFLFLLEDTELTHEEVKIMTKDITERVNVTSDFLENLLNWSQSQLQGFKSYKRLVDVHIVTEELFYLFKTHAESKGIVLINNVALNTELLTDANTIKLVLRNLITNAIKFTSQGYVKVSCIFKNKFVIISVEDTGVGLTPDVIEKLFTGNNTSSLGTANEKGSGLGLMLCKEFVEGNGGTIWMETVVGKGSTFYFSLPISKESE